MANMSYCQFSNTLEDLRQCYDDMDQELTNPAEKRARFLLIRLCTTISEDYGYEVEGQKPPPG